MAKSIWPTKIPTSLPNSRFPGCCPLPEGGPRSLAGVASRPRFVSTFKLLTLTKQSHLPNKTKPVLLQCATPSHLVPYAWLVPMSTDWRWLPRGSATIDEMPPRPGEWCMAIACLRELENRQCQTRGTWKSQACPVPFKLLLVRRWRAPSVAKPQGTRPVGDWMDGELGVRPSPAWHRLGILCCT